MESFSEIVKYLNIPQTLIIIVAMWFFYNRLDTKIGTVETKLDGKIDNLETKLENKIEKLRDEMKEEIKALNRRLDDDLKAVNSRLDNVYQLIVTIFRKDAA